MKRATQRTAKQKRPSLAGKAQTVLGPIAAGRLGVTLTHEHFLIDTSHIQREPEEASRRAKFNAPFSIEADD